jgi:hypothetical protein
MAVEETGGVESSRVESGGDLESFEMKSETTRETTIYRSKTISNGA